MIMTLFFHFLFLFSYFSHHRRSQKTTTPSKRGVGAPANGLAAQGSRPSSSARVTSLASDIHALSWIDRAFLARIARFFLPPPSLVGTTVRHWLRLYSVSVVTGRTSLSFVLIVPFHLTTDSLYLEPHPPSFLETDPEPPLSTTPTFTKHRCADFSRDSLLSL